jgi:UDP-N-acetylmuramoyl-tripeptide--D-alanyl-D-alanine ligase
MKQSRELVERALRERSARVGSAVPADLGEVVTDTRADVSGRLFFALAGERFDAHDFAGEALAKGATAVIVERVPDGVGENRLIVVDDVLRALQDLAHAHLMSVEARRVALTGSNGKTSTKELVAAVVGACVGEDRVLATEGNLNNHIGLPLTALRTESDHAVVVLEMGMNHLGEIERLCEIADPDVGLVTNIGVAHAGPLGGIEGVAQAKGELFAGLRKDAVGVVNADDPRVVAQADARLAGRALRFGRAADAHVRLVASRTHEESGLVVTLAHDGHEASARVPYEGEHNAQNAAAAVAVAVALGLEFQTAVAGLERARVVGGRLKRCAAASGALVLDDTYNANPDSMRAAFAALASLAGDRRRVVALGDMLELGDDAELQHELIARAAVQSGVARLFACGTFREAYKKGALAAGLDGDAVELAEDSAALAPRVLAATAPQDAVLAKGSRGARMERVVERLLQGGDD